jgi:hypothetical protein
VQLMLRPYLRETIAKPGVSLYSIFMLLGVFAIIWQFVFGPIWRNLSTGQPQSVLPVQLYSGATPDAPAPFVVELAAPTVIVEVNPQIEVVMPTPAAPLTIVQGVGEDPLPHGYVRMRAVGRFSNYWPPLGGTNCFSDCEHFADGGRVDEAIVEGQRVVACPRDLLLGTRIEWPTGSGVVWTCRDHGEAITFYYSETGLPVYWFDFLSPDAFVDFGSFIQVDIYVPCEQLGQCGIPTPLP